MGVILSSVGISTIISGIITGIGYWLNYQNTGKKLENYKKMLEAKGVSFEKTLEIYTMINIIEINLVNDELNSASRCSEPLERLITEFNMNEIFIPEKVTEKIKKFIIDFNKYTSVLEDLDDLKDRQAELKLNEQDSNSDELNKESDELFNTLSKDYSRLRKEIKIKFTMFD